MVIARPDRDNGEHLPTNTRPLWRALHAKHPHLFLVSTEEGNALVYASDEAQPVDDGFTLTGPCIDLSLIDGRFGLLPPAAVVPVAERLLGLA